MKNYHIWMADIIQSRKKDGARVMKDFRELVSGIQNDFMGRFLSPPTVTLGDEFQSIVTSVQSGIEVIFALEELLIKRDAKFKLRHVLYYGPIDTKINPTIAYGMLGGGLSEARDLLGRKKSKKIRFHFRLKDARLSDGLGLAFTLYQSIVDAWRPKDYEILRQFWIDDDYKKVARRLKKDSSLIWRRKNSLRLHEYQAVKKLVCLMLKEPLCH
ncbi:MAG: hypothetical protein JXO51_07230 [Candidatus Aminicenantes bacterium]|nr:hypothetical protein [Candidatus Aminicenantes bacterium]